MDHSRQVILCVDDDKDTSAGLSILLELSGYAVKTAGSVAEGLSLAQSERFDLYLFDYNFTDGTGIELCERLRSFDTTTPVVFCSGEGREEERELAGKVGAQAYLVKPVDPGVLLQTIALWLNPVAGRDSWAQSKAGN
jgi:DNA-binding response OmpR family regulator